MSLTQFGDIYDAQPFAQYVIEETEIKSRLIQSGAMAANDFLSTFLAGPGKTVDMPKWDDLNVNSDGAISPRDSTAASDETDAANTLQPQKITSRTETAVRLNRSEAWSSADLMANLAGEDPLRVAVARVSSYWARELQKIYIAMWRGVNDNNGTAHSGDYAVEIVGTQFVDGVTNFSAESFIDAAATLGDSLDETSICMMHSLVYARAQKNNLIDFIPDARGEINIPTFLGRQVIVDDGMPSGTNVVRKDGSAGAAGMYETWIAGAGSTYFAQGTPKTPSELHREPLQGNGYGVETLISRVEYSLHPRGHAFLSSSIEDDGGPSNSELAEEAQWARRVLDRRTVKFARLITRES